MNRPLRRALAPIAVAAALLGAALAPSPARAGAYLDEWHPHQTFWSVGYEAGFPVGSLKKNWVSNPGWIGGGFDLRFGVVGRLSVGAAGTWNWFSQTYQNYSVQGPNSLITGTIYRRLGAFTLRANVHYYLTATAIQPYVGLGIGGVWTSSRLQVVNVPQFTDVAAWTAGPEFGVLFNVAPRFALYLLGRYEFTLASWSSVEHAQWIGAQAGFAFYY